MRLRTCRGCRAFHNRICRNRNAVETATAEGESPVRVTGKSEEKNPVRIRGDHPARLNTPGRPIVDQYREGKVGSTPGRGVKENLKPFVYKRWERSDPRPRAFCIMSLRVGRRRRG